MSGKAETITIKDAGKLRRYRIRRDGNGMHCVEILSSWNSNYYPSRKQEFDLLGKFPLLRFACWFRDLHAATGCVGNTSSDAVNRKRGGE